MTDWYSAGATRARVVEVGYATRRVYAGRVLHVPTGTVEECSHRHYTPELASRCAARVARDHNAVVAFDLEPLRGDR